VSLACAEALLSAENGRQVKTIRNVIRSKDAATGTGALTILGGSFGRQSLLVFFNGSGHLRVVTAVPRFANRFLANAHDMQLCWVLGFGRSALTGGRTLCC
jgi:hypothetical protein